MFMDLFALITIPILYSSKSAPQGPKRWLINLKWTFSNTYFPILGNKMLPSPCNQCVTITSASHLLGTKPGPEVERAECTIHMNDAPSHHYLLLG